MQTGSSGTPPHTRQIFSEGSADVGRTVAACRPAGGSIESLIVSDSDGNGSAPAVQSAADRRPRLISAVVPVYREEQVLVEFHRRATAALAGMAPEWDHELIFVNDGSDDGSSAILETLAAGDANTRVIGLARNFGHQLAITAGLDHARGDVAVILDADLQDPPELIPEMVRRWREGYKVVYGVRQSRAGESRFKLRTARLFYRFLSRLSDTPIPLDTGDFRLLDRAVIDALIEIREESRYLRGLVSWIGFRQCPLPYAREPRHGGVTKFPLRKMLRFGLDGLSSFSEKPLRLSSHLGFLITTISLLMAVAIVIAKIVGPSNSVAGWTSVMVAVLFLGGIQLMCMGILGEYVGRIFRQSKGRPLYIVAERVNFDRAPRSAPAIGGSPVTRGSP